MIEVTSGLIGLITGIAALASILIFIYNRGRQEGESRAIIKSLKDIVPQMVDVQNQLARVCEQISNQAKGLNRGTEKFDRIDRELSAIKDRLARLEARVNGYRLQAPS